MSVDVDVDAVVSDWASDEESRTARLLFVGARHRDHRDRMASKEALRRVAYFVADGGKWVDDEGMPCAVSHPVLTPEGVAVAVESSSVAPLIGFVKEVADLLGADRWSGTLTTRADEVQDHPLAAAVYGASSVLALSGWAERPGGRHTAIVPWRTGSDIASRLTDLAMDWIAGDGRFELRHVTTVPVDSRDELRELLQAALADQEAPTLVSASQSDATRRCTVTFVRPGHALIHVRDPDSDPVDLAELHTPFLRRWASIVDWSALTLSPPVGHASLERLLTLSHGLRVGHYYRHCRYLDRERLPDAFALQVVTDRHLEAADDLTDWTISPLGHGMNELSAPSVREWFDTADTISRLGCTPATPLEAARTAFGGVLNTDDNPPPR